MPAVVPKKVQKKTGPAKYVMRITVTTPTPQTFKAVRKAAKSALLSNSAFTKVTIAENVDPG